MTAIDGELTALPDGGWRVAFERNIERPPARVWAALTDPVLLRNWLGDVEVELRIGGKYIIHFRDDPTVMTGTITALDVGRLLEYSWLESNDMPQSRVRWEIAETSEGCGLTLKHTFPRNCRREQIVPFLGGWQAYLDIVPEASDGAFVPYAVGYEKALGVAYRAKYQEGKSP